MKKSAGLLSLSLITSGAAFAQDDAAPKDGSFRPGWYAAPMATYFIADSERCGVDDGLGAALALGHRGDFAGLELWGQYLAASADCPGAANGSGDVKLNGGGLGLVAGPFFEGRILSRFFGLVGFGVIQRQDHPQYAQDDTTIFGDAGVGYLQPLALRLMDFDMNLRAEARYRYDVQQPPRPEGPPAQYQDILVNVGLQIPLSAAPRPAPQKVAVVAPVVTDADHDGVADDADQCPGTPSEAKVNAVGCPASELAEAKAGDTVVLSGVNFELGSDVLTEDATLTLNAVAGDLAARPEIKVEIGGHTDDSGDEAYNQDLSQRRAESVRSYLTEQGVDAGRLTAVGYGESQPVAGNDSAEGRAQNRRVELKVAG